MNNIYQQAEEIVFQNHPPRYATDIQSDRANHKDSRLLQHHVEMVEKEVNRLEKSSAVIPQQDNADKDFHSILPPSNSIIQQNN